MSDSHRCLCFREEAVSKVIGTARKDRRIAELYANSERFFNQKMRIVMERRKSAGDLGDLAVLKISCFEGGHSNDRGTGSREVQSAWKRTDIYLIDYDVDVEFGGDGNKDEY
ncbi:hypothetical protein AB6A40_011569 [Gnathostoma spinigerum]|uniref:Uncharacterized protein n=1 Tax=Gnathostoma spinigerum TaxID=75299 RepID=A0ABD6EY25_9BILA